MPPAADSQLLASPRPARLLALFGAYLALAVLATWPLAARAGQAVYGVGTPPLNVWAIGWVLHQLPRDPLRLFDANAFYPYPGSLAFSEHLFVPALQAAPFAALSGNLVLAHNAVVLLTLATAGLGMFLLARELTGDALAGFAAGLLYAFHTWNINELIRLQILSNQWFPLLIWSLLRWFAAPSPRRAALAALFCTLQALSCMYWALYLPLLLIPLLAALQWRWRRRLRELLPLALAFGLALLACLPFAVPYLDSSAQLGHARPPPLPIDASRYLDVLPGNWLYAGWLGDAAVNRDAAHFPGFVALALGALGAAAGRTRPGAGVSRALLILGGAAGVVLSLGTELSVAGRVLGSGPYRHLYDLVPGFQQVRYPERFSLFAMLALAPLVAAGLARLRPRLGTAGLAALAALLLVEHLSVPLPLAPLPGGSAVPSVYRWLKGRGDVRVVAEVPSSRYRGERHDALPMLFSAAHWKRTVQGFTGYFPPAYNYTRWRLYHFPSPESLRFCRQFGIDTVVVRPDPDGRPPAWTEAGPWRRSGPFPEGHVVLQLEGVAAAPPAAPAPIAPLRLVSPRWAVQASRPGAALAVDSDPRTAWSTGDPQGRGDFFRIRFAELRRVSRVSLAVGPPFELPLHLRLLGESPEAGWHELRFDAVAAFDRLLAALLHRPRDAWLDLELERPQSLSALRVRISRDDDFRLPWTLAEVRVWAE